MEKLYKEDLVELINDIQYPVLIHDIETFRFLAINKAAVELFGYSSQEFMKMSIADIRSTDELLYFKENNRWQTYSFGGKEYHKLVANNGKEVLASISTKNIIYRKRQAEITTVYDLTDLVNYDNKLTRSEEKFRISQEISLDGFIILNPVADAEVKDFRFEYVNPAARKLLDLLKIRFIDNSFRKSFASFEELFRICKEALYNSGHNQLEVKYLSPEGDRWLRFIVIRLLDRVAVSILDFTSHKTQQMEIEHKNKELNEIVERISDSFIALDKNWNIIYVNDSALRILNSDKSVIGKNFWEEFPVYKETSVKEYMQQAMINQMPATYELEGKLTPRWYRVSFYPSQEGISIFGVDTTLSRAYEEHLMSSLRQKEGLLKEVHHRIKNNLQIIISILNLQSYYLTDPKALEIFKQSQNRIRSMALIHEKLYKTESLSSINLENYVSDIVKYLTSSYYIDDEKINIILDMDNIELDSNTAISFGLIVNELVSNSLKYAFPHESSGRIELKAKKNGTKLLFEVTDNGKGFPKDFDFEDTNSLGLQLVNTLVNQLNGEIKIETNPETKFKILIPYNK
jgi:PAS domain S-box-containing protein